MKKHLFIISILVHSAFISQAQWQPDVRLTNNTSPSNTSLNNAWCVAASGDTVFAVWDDERAGNYEIYYKRSTDAGLTWGEDTRLTVSQYSYDPCITIKGSMVHVVWQELRDGYYEIYYKRSTDAGVSWEADTRLTTNTSDSWNPSIAVNGSAVHVVWEDERQGNSEVYYKGSTDGGLTWGADTRLTNDPANSWNPSVAVSGSVVHVAWYDDRNGSGNWEIYYKRSADGGLNWGEDTRMTNDTHVSRYPCLAVSGSVVHLVWHDDRDGNYDIYYKRSTDGGLTWSADTRLTTDPANAMFPCLAVSASTVHIVWIDPRNTPNVQIFYKRSTDGGLSWETDLQLSSSSLSTYPSVAVSGSVVHAVWQDMRDGNYEIYYKRNPTGDPTGIIAPAVSGNTIQVFPNPFTNEITVNNSINEPSEITVYDITSRKVIMQKFTSKATLNTTQLGKGIYLFEVKTKNTVLRNGRIIKD
ncbi:MAG: exo-alpha-sialidase [Bacteroidota bacterium]